MSNRQHPELILKGLIECFNYRIQGQFVLHCRYLFYMGKIKLEIDMDKNAIEVDIKSNLVRAGKIFKRSKFLKEWRPRYLILTSNYLYTFTDEKMEELTDQIKLKDLKSYKSYLRKDEEMIPPGFKLRSSDDMLYFCAKDCNEKWSWIVTLERLLDYTYMGANNYNNLDWVKNRGFDSQIEYQNGGNVAPPPPPPKKQVKTSQQAEKEVDDQVNQILKQLEEQQKQLQQRKKDLEHRESSFQQEQKRLEEEKQFYARISLQEKEKTSQAQQDPRASSRVAQLRNLYENRMTAPQGPTIKYDFSKYEDVKAEDRKELDINLFRSATVAGLFEEFKKDCAYPEGLTHIVNFLINAGGDERMGYSSFVVIEGKSHLNRLVFSQHLITELNNFVDYENCQNLMKFLEICVFQIPGLFTMDQISIIQKKLRDIFQLSENEDTLALILKNMFILHKMKKYQRDDIFHKLDRLVKEVKKEETRNWARKLRDIL